MALKQYIGARYTPKFEGLWNASKEYSALSVVYANNKSYVSRKTVPAGTEVSDTDYWVQSADWNAQVEQYNQNVTQYKEQVDTLDKNVKTYTKQVNQFYADTLHSYETRDEMIADTNIKVGDTLLTCGKDAIGDGGGSFYQVVDKQSAKTIVLANGLYAEPFEFQPYDYAAFEQKTDEYKAEVDKQLDEVEKYSLRNYDTTSKMVADKNLTSGNTVLTSGETSVGDGRGSFWKVVDQQGSDTTALANGKYAKPFQLYPYNAGNYVVDVLNTANSYAKPPCLWTVDTAKLYTINLGVLPNHTVDGETKVHCKMFVLCSWEKTATSILMTIIHGGYDGNPAIQYDLTIPKPTNSNQKLICVQLIATANTDGYSKVSNTYTTVTEYLASYDDTDIAMEMFGDETNTTTWDGIKATSATFAFEVKKDLAYFQHYTGMTFTQTGNLTRRIVNSNGKEVYNRSEYISTTNKPITESFSIYTLPADTYTMQLSVSAGQFTLPSAGLTATNNAYLNTKTDNAYNTLAGRFKVIIGAIPEGTIVTYGDTLHYLNWYGNTTNKTTTYHFELKPQKCDLKIRMRLTLNNSKFTKQTCTVTLSNSAGTTFATSENTAFYGNTIKEFELTATNLQAGTYNIAVSTSNSACRYSTPETAGNAISNEYINAQPDVSVPAMIGQYIISNITT